MLPVYLKLKNFLSHKESEIDFTTLDYVTLIVGINRGDPKKSNGAGKCVTGDTLIAATDGTLHRIDNIVNDVKPLEIWSINSAGHLVPTTVVGWHRQGVKKIYKIVTSTGKQIRATNNHPFLTYDGTKLLRDLQIEDRIACPRRIKTKSRGCAYPMTSQEANLLAYMLTEGTVGRHRGRWNVSSFTNTDPEIVEECNALLLQKGGKLVASSYANYSIRNSDTYRGKHSVSYKKWFEQMGLVNKVSLNKEVPESIFRSGENVICHFLGRYLACDGTVCKTNNKWEIGYSSSSETLIRQLQHLLLRLGIVSIISTRPSQYSGKVLGHSTYYLYCSGKNELQLFNKKVGKFVIGRKQQRLRHMVSDLDKIRSNPNIDVIPLEARADIDRIIRDEFSWKKLNKHGITGPYYGTNCYSRQKVQAIAAIMNHDGLREIAHSDIIWEEIKSITPDGEEATYDIEIDANSHYFVANDMFIHNSTIFDAITWALFEKCRISGSKSTGLDNVVRSGQKKAEVEFRFKLDNDLYRVVRSRNVQKRKSDVAFQVQNGKKWESVSIDKKTETNSKIAELVGISYDVFVRSVLLEQHDADGFAKLTPGGRKEVVSHILQLDHYDTYVKHAKESLEAIDIKLMQSDTFIRDNVSAVTDKAEAESQLKVIEGKIDIVQKQVVVLKKLVEKIRGKLNTEQKKVLQHEGFVKQRKELGERLHRVTNEMREWTQKVEQAKKNQKFLEEEVKEKYDRLMELKEARGDPAKIKRALEKYRELKEKADSAHANITVKVKTILGKIEDIQDEVARIEKLDEGECPTCYGKVTQESKGRALDKLQEQLNKLKEGVAKYRGKLEEVNTKKKLVEERLTEAELERDHYNNAGREARLIKKDLDNARQQLTANKDVITDADQRRLMNKEDLDKLQDQMAEVLEQLEAAEDVNTDKYEELRAEIGEKVAELEDAQENLSAFQIKKGQLQERIQVKTDVVRKIEDIKKSRVKLDNERRIYRELIQAFGRTGIQALILENSAVEIEKIANNLLNKITDGKVGIQIVTQRKNKDGTLSECFDINITDEFHSSPFNMYSIAGDEQVVVRDGEQTKVAAIESLWDSSRDSIMLDERNQLEAQLTSYLPLGCNSNGEVSFEQALALVRHKAPEYLYRLTANPGNYAVCLTGAHSVYVLTSNGLISKRVKDIQIGDLVLTPKSIPQMEKADVIDLMDYIDQDSFTNRVRYDDKYVWLKSHRKIGRFIQVNTQLCILLGWMVAEGSATDSSLWFSLGDEEREAERIKGLLQLCFSYEGASVQRVTKEQIKGGNVDQYRVECGSRLLSHIIGNMIGESCYIKRVPEFIFNSSATCKRGFIKGLQEGDGGIYEDDSRSKVEQYIASSSKKLITDVIILLRQLGSNARVDEWNGNYKVLWQEVVKTDRWAQIPVDLFDKKCFKYAKYVNGNRKSFHMKEVEDIWTVRPENLDYIKSIAESWNILKITKVEQIRATNEYVYDFSVPNGESFVGGLGGFLLHNSGGEKFRIAFAIRIALSTLLARRSGVKVPAIFYDEAFTDLDADGVEKLMEIFNVLAKEFRYQLVVTHQTELKSQFNDIITVVKTDEGSIIKCS